MHERGNKFVVALEQVRDWCGGCTSLPFSSLFVGSFRRFVVSSCGEGRPLGFLDGPDRLSFYESV